MASLESYGITYKQYTTRKTYIHARSSYDIQWTYKNENRLNDNQL